MDGNRGVSDSQYLAGVEGMGYPATVPPPSAPPLRCRTVARPERKPRKSTAMPVQNYVSGAVTAAQGTTVTTALGTIRSTLTCLRNLTPEDRRSIPKMGGKSFLFVNQAFQAAKTNSGKLPASFDLPGFESDLALYNALLPLASQITQLNELFDDTMLALGSDLYSESLEAYTYLKAGNAAAGLDELKATMSKRFMRSKPAKEETPAATPAATT